MSAAPAYFLAPTAVVVGEVNLAAGVNIWFGTIVRGDVAAITLGENVNLQDGCIVHCDYDVPQLIEPGVVVGHGAILHGRRIGRDTLVGIGARLLSGCEVGEECLIAAGAVVVERQVIPPRSVVMGIPGQVVRSIRPEELSRTQTICARYRALAVRYAAGELAPVGVAARWQVGLVQDQAPR
jgi:carbonic anhydrase/acetyltransferase-like protein (isoleucine patch superfamily)